MVDTLKCILISLDDDVIELKDLAESLNYSIDEVFIQHRKTPDSKYFIGRGKVKEIEEHIKENEIQVVVVNSALKPSQQYNLENILKIIVYDRLRLILEIFSDRAHSEEARLQVELAKLQYEAPLLRDWIHKARYGEKPGFMAGGEYEVAQYYEISRKRIKKIKQKLNKIEKERDLRRKQRRSKGYYLVGIVGYTNAGKSTLFNLISGESVKVENRLFTTLSTTTRKIPKVKKSIILTDTVGLIDNLPHWMIGSFHSTLEEMFLSDLILLVVDFNEKISEINRKLRTSFDVLLPDIEPSKILLILNKIDKIENNQNNDIQDLIKQLQLDYKINDVVSLSAQDPKHKDKIISKIQEIFGYPEKLLIVLPNISKTQSFINWLHEHCDIIAIQYEDNISIDLRYKNKDRAYILKTIKSLKGSILKDKSVNQDST
jgi:GTP-binding protein HflX